MEELRIRPEIAYRHTMVIIWGIIALLGFGAFLTLFLLIPKDFKGLIVLSVFTGCFAVIMLLTIIYIPLYVASLEYVISGKSVRMKGGVLWRRQVNVPFTKITNVDTSQGPLQRLFGIGSVHVQTAGAGGAQGAQAELRIAGIRDFDRIKDTVFGRIEKSGSAGDLSIQAASSGENESDKQILLTGILTELKAIRELLARPRT